ncbi:glycosyltransferase family 2 protein [Microbacterium caowuchunii]|uniref:Glycosyltransferase family 2 protein n=1 Tax=Microbacterium caowuchunii TaxID=2614638 RepID=A0A5N0TD26_9MICO|nr:galactosyltransferase-related protein [Microbacterium caowuchunii]KAA9131746.1 glycosyltransferase family 2 protein [Microbacterium caowuchunii]
MSRVALITIARGRHAHWLRQSDAVRRSERAPDDRILVTMGDSELAELARADPSGVHVVELPGAAPELPLARARNAGAEAALARGADVLVFLDVDCLPVPGLLGAYADAAALPAVGARLLCGPVTYLEPPPATGYALDQLPDCPHPARPAPAPGKVLLGDDPDLFWSLSFALTAESWRRIGGFCEEYIGYGGEDTDFGHTARERGVGMAWVGSARAHHQHHEVEDPPLRHLDAILRNGALFAERWGRWPMAGWLDAFADRGLVERTSDGGYRQVGAPLG